MDATGQEKLSNRRPFKRVNEKRVLEVFRRGGVETVLDVGCGIGNTVAHLVACGFDAHGVTINPPEIEASGIPGRLAVADIQHPLQHPRLPFDAIISFDCLEHLENPPGALRNINAALKTSGQFICYIPPVKWTEYDCHVIVYTPRQMKWLLNLTGFRLEGTEGRFRGKGVTYYTVKQSAGQLQPGNMK